MRARPFHATLMAAALFAGAATLAQAQDIDLFGDVDTPADTPVQPPKAVAPATATPIPSLLVDPSEWVPGHPTQIQAQATSSPSAVKSDGLDPGAVVKPSVPAPAKDPLEAIKPDPGKPDAGKTDAAKTEAGKAETKAAAAPLQPANAAIKAALDKRGTADIRGLQASERRKERTAVGAYYAARKYAPTWSLDGAPVAAVSPVLTRLARAGDDALTVPAVPAGLVVKGTPDEIAANDIAMTEAVVAYARQASGARVDPRAISPLIGSRPELADPTRVLDSVAAAGPEAGDKLAALNPKDPRYVALRDKLESLHGTRVAAAPIAAGPILRIGMHDPRVPALRSRLGLVASDLVADEDEYDVSIAEAIAAFQGGNGLHVTGKLDRATVAALSGGGKASSLEATLEANMEMWRWMPRDLGRDRIEVDVPAYTVTVFHDGEAVASNRVVVGKTDTPTPLFSNVMKYLIVNPVWNVPQSIIKKDMMAKIDRQGGTLRGFDVTYRNGQMVVKQPSGAKNALGQIKFIFPNDFSVYLHDTPSKSLFSAAKRAFSHGCVRVDQPFDFAFSVLNDGVPEGGKILWSQKRLEKLIGDDERYVNLPKPLPIHIEYFTASVDAEAGRLIQREDIYGYAHAVAAALSGEARPAQVAAEHKPREKAAARAPRAPVAKTAVATDEDPR